MTYATRAELLGLIERREADCPLPDGHIVRIREYTAAEWLDAVVAGEPDEQGNATNHPAFYAMLTIHTLIDGPGGEPLFTRDDFPMLVKSRHPRQGWSMPQIVGDAAFSLSEVGPENLKSVGDTPDTGQSGEDVRTPETDSGDAGTGLQPVGGSGADADGSGGVDGAAGEPVGADDAGA